MKSVYAFSPILAITRYSVEEYYDRTLVSVCFSTVETLLPSLYFILSMSIFFFLPLIILIILYALIAKTLMGHPNLMAPYKNNTIPSQSVIKYRKQLVAMLGTVVLAFFVCLLPFRAFTLWIIIVPADSILSLGLETYYNLLYFCKIMFHINSAINPILYNIMSSKFRNGFFRVCGIKHLHVCYKKTTDINRKNTFNTTSSTNTSSQQTSESFLNRYHRHHQHLKYTDSMREHSDGESSKNNNKDQHMNDVYVRMPLHLPKKTKRLMSGESFV